MHAGRHYSIAEIATWTRRETAGFLLLALVPTALYRLAGWTFLGVSWLPVALIGGAVAFITGFKNNAAYARLWEARQVWGGIINGSRTFGLLVLDVVPDPVARRRILLRHLAWVTALRYQLREPRPWENMRRAHNTEYARHYRVDEWEQPIEPHLECLLDRADLQACAQPGRRATRLLASQVRDLRSQAETSTTGEIRHLELVRLVAAFVEAQGKCERLKNYPYPRQFATLNLFFVWLLIVLVPFGLLNDFGRLGPDAVWLTVPASVAIAWVFHTMDKIGESSENPFEGGPNDVPITAMSRTIEIDVRDLLGDDLPPALTADHNILM